MQSTGNSRDETLVQFINISSAIFAESAFNSIAEYLIMDTATCLGRLQHIHYLQPNQGILASCLA